MSDRRPVSREHERIDRLERFTIAMEGLAAVAVRCADEARNAGRVVPDVPPTPPAPTPNPLPE